MTSGVFVIVGLILLCLLVLIFWEEIADVPIWMYRPVEYDRSIDFAERDGSEPSPPGDGAASDPGIGGPTPGNFTQGGSDPGDGNGGN